MQYTLVSNDLHLIRAAEKDGYKVLSCEEFGRRILARPEEPEKGAPPSPGEVDYWMREFGLDPASVAERITPKTTAGGMPRR